MPALLKLVPRPASEAPPASGPELRSRRRFAGDDAALGRAFLDREPAAREALYARYEGHVHRVLYRVLGFRADLADLHHDVFVRALVSLPKLEDPGALKAWLTSITVHVAHSAIASRKRRSWLWFLPSDALPDVDAAVAPPDVRDALRATYAALEQLPADDRIAFALRYIDGMELTEVAAACDTSLTTIKRRLARAAHRFEIEARKHAALAVWLEGGARWSNLGER
ncbi:MAG TPA: sigma-70 family RNA polymerase sigma factor [Byssovorax sp.]